nr:sulfatase [Ereboglobus sp. PH5-10]
MSPKLPLIQTTLGVCAFAASAVSIPAASQPKNIVLMLVDDLGWGDTGPYGGRFAETPNFDRLAKEGMRFTNAYAPAPICSATRAAIMTGKSPARLNFEFVIQARGSKPPPGTILRQPDFPRFLDPAETSMGDVMGAAGYVTGYFGKWHLSEHGVPGNERYLGYGSQGPDKQGFVHVNEERGSHPYSYPKGKKNRPGYGDFREGEFAPDLLTDRMIDFLKAHRDEKFFLCLSHYYVHAPIHTRCEWLIKKYKAKAARMGLKMDKEHIEYAAFVETMDHLVGRVLDEMDSLGLAQNTLFVLMSDNGGDPRFADNGGLRGGKWTLYEGGTRVPLMARWPGIIGAGSVNDTPVIGTDLMATFCEALGVKKPASAVDSMSFLPLLTGKATALPRDTLTWHFPFYHPRVTGTKPISSIRKGDLKLIYFYEDDRLELFDLKNDPLEKNDLSSLKTQIAANMKKTLLDTLNAQGARFPTKRE